MRPAWCGLMLMEVGGFEWSCLASKAGQRETKSDRFGEHLLPLSLSQTRLDYHGTVLDMVGR